MRILMATMSFDIGGAETHILELCRELCRLGHEVTVVSKGGVFVDSLTKSGIRHVTAPLHKKDPLSLLKSRRIIEGVIREEKPRVIHSHARIASMITCDLAKKYDIPFVTTFHYTFDPVWYLKMLTRTGERMLAVSDDLKKYLIDVYGRDADKIGVTVNGIEIEQFEGKTRTDKSGKTQKLLGLFVNLADYQFGSTRGGEVTKFEDFDIDFNQHKYLMETRLSGALTKIYSAIALEEPVTESAAG